MSRLTRHGTAKPNSLELTLRREQEKEKFRFFCSADHKQVWQPYLVDAQSAESDDHTHTHMYTWMDRVIFLFHVLCSLKV